MPVLPSYDYALVRVVPRVERAEFINVGAIVLCRTRRFLAARIELDLGRLIALWSHLEAPDLEEIQTHLELIPRICEGGPTAGPIGQLSQTERFHWLVAARSTIIQCSPPHSGLCTSPQVALDQLIATLVKE